MGERKVINKYYPPDFDPSKLPRGKKPKNAQITVRVMLPMTCCCNTCGEYIYKGKKFNSRKETVIGEEYLGIKIFRFYIKCTRCSAELTFKTDPEHSAYRAEFGMKENFEPMRVDMENDLKRKQREESEDGDAMKALENRTIDSKKEMDILDTLDELRALNARAVKVDLDELLAERRKRFDQMERDACELSDDDDVLDSIVFENSVGFVRRVADDDVMERVKLPAKRMRKELQSAEEMRNKRRKRLGLVKVKVTPQDEEVLTSVVKKEPGEEIESSGESSATSSALSSVLSCYSDSESD